MAKKAADKSSSANSPVIRSQKATAAEIRASLMVKPYNERIARKANRIARQALGGSH